MFLVEGRITRRGLVFWGWWALVSSCGLRWTDQTRVSSSRDGKRVWWAWKGFGSVRRGGDIRRAAEPLVRFWTLAVGSEGWTGVFYVCIVLVICFPVSKYSFSHTSTFISTFSTPFTFFVITQLWGRRGTGQFTLRVLYAVPYFVPCACSWFI